MDELNMLACITANVGGIKRTGMTQILGCLNILHPVQIESWNKYQSIYAKSVECVTEKSLEAAGKEAADQAGVPCDHEGVTNVTGTVDGSWLTRRGHSSLHGVATCCSTADPPKVLGYEVLSRHCSTCSGLLGVREMDEEAYQRLLAEHFNSGCDANHTGSSAGTEAAVFRRSENKHLLRYTTFVGDGDAANERALLDAEPYGKDTLKKSYEGKKVADGLQISGRAGRLTDEKIHQLTTYYGSAIRSHVHDLKSMQAACW
ncbi:unnamed protein product, partial [Didymodactylos carnosus]